ncbi:hypothetical protein TCE0_041r13787 [Talaromyces pinophilus]|jgi:hypothetical protein|uniref:Uncharacterized protein n=1 Tax=Talaromyces pinophilus TaxID=128442 RepID=A0A6V8HN78_TALPI|nr:hypothetical protein TCE0_041r13787 [Talaromyces pinophilus]
MQTLLKTQIDEADAHFKDLIQSSNGEFEESHIDLKAGGITMRQFMDWHKEWNAQLKFTGDTVGFYREKMVPAHPEHYALPPYPLAIIEHGRTYCSFTTPTSSHPGVCAKVWHSLVGKGPDEENFGRRQHVFLYRNVEDGPELRLRLLFSAVPLNLFSMNIPSTWPLSFEFL